MLISDAIWRIGKYLVGMILDPICKGIVLGIEASILDPCSVTVTLYLKGELSPVSVEILPHKEKLVRHQLDSELNFWFYLSKTPYNFTIQISAQRCDIVENGTYQYRNRFRQFVMVGTFCIWKLFVHQL